MDRLIGSIIFNISTTVSPHREKSAEFRPVRPLGLCRSRRRCSSLPHADVTPPDVLPLLLALCQRAGRRVGGRGRAVHSGQPEAVDVGKVVAGSSRPLALHEGLGPEVYQAAS